MKKTNPWAWSPGPQESCTWPNCNLDQKRYDGTPEDKKRADFCRPTCTYDLVNRDNWFAKKGMAPRRWITLKELKKLFGGEQN